MSTFLVLSGLTLVGWGVWHWRNSLRDRQRRREEQRAADLRFREDLPEFRGFLESIRSRAWVLDEKSRAAHAHAQGRDAAREVQARLVDYERWSSHPDIARLRAEVAMVDHEKLLLFEQGRKGEEALAAILATRTEHDREWAKTERVESFTVARDELGIKHQRDYDAFRSEEAESRRILEEHLAATVQEATANLEALLHLPPHRRSAILPVLFRLTAATRARGLNTAATEREEEVLGRALEEAVLLRVAASCAEQERRATELLRRELEGLIESFQVERWRNPPRFEDPAVGDKLAATLRKQYLERLPNARTEQQFGEFLRTLSTS